MSKSLIVAAAAGAAGLVMAGLYWRERKDGASGADATTAAAEHSRVLSKLLDLEELVTNELTLHAESMTHAMRDIAALEISLSHETARRKDLTAELTGAREEAAAQAFALARLGVSPDLSDLDEHVERLSAASDDDEYMQVRVCGSTVSLASGALGSTTVDQLAYDQSVGTISPGASLSEALAALAPHHAGCLLVCDEGGRGKGVLTMTDTVVGLLVDPYQTVAHVARTYSAVRPTTTLSAVLSYLERQYDYISVGNTQLVSQGSVLRFFNAHVACTPEDGDCLRGVTARDCIEPQSAYRRRTSCTALFGDTLRYLCESGLRSLVLVDEEDRPKAVFSLSDVKRVDRPEQLLNRSALEVLTSCGEPSTQCETRPLVQCGPDRGAIDVMATMVAQNVHAVLVMDGEQFLGVVSVASLLAKFR